jgi:hydrogenase-4 transcriptional activator
VGTTKPLLEVWRTFCLLESLPEALNRIGPGVLRSLRASAVVVRQLDVRGACLRTVAQHPVRPPEARAPLRDILSPAGLRDLLEALRRPGARVLSPGDGRDALALARPGGTRSDCLAGPLTGTGGPLGVLLGFATGRSRPFDADRVAIFENLLEPFSAALDNHCRIERLASEREAAEADRQSLLVRLGRREISEVIVGADAGLRDVMERVGEVCRSDVPVLIFGETGSGKEVVARAIHKHSARSAGPFLRVNCGAIAPELVDSELFGHERGSFTGATALRKGWFERADGGTLFLDEVAELSPAAQVRLLRVLQDGTFERVGGERQLHVDVRIVAATHRDLAAMVAGGRFREDLWYRLAVFPIDLPSLRERREDLPALATHFALRSAQRFGLPYIAPTPDDLRTLGDYEWPGNIRELASVIDRAAILGRGGRLQIAQALGVQRNAGAPRETGPADTRDGTPASPALDDVVRRHIERVLRQTRGRVEGRSGAARLLGVNPHTLRSRMRKLGIDWARFRES